MMELLSPAGGWEAMTAAVQNGADAVYMGFGGLNARRSARNFTDEEFREAVAYCHLRGVKVYLTLNTLVTDRELSAAAEHNDDNVVAQLAKMVPTFTPTRENLKL